MIHAIMALILFSGCCFLIAKQASMMVCTILYAMGMILMMQYASPSLFLESFLWLVLGVFLLMALRPLRKKLISSHLFKMYSQVMPQMSDTEREALEAGTVSWEGDLFSGSPDFKSLLNAPSVKLSAAEQAFMDGPTETLCRMLDDWEITHQRTDMSPEIWAYIKEQGFLGMIIPKAYGGLELSATAQVAVLSKLYGRSITAATTVSVPNSLGPSELLLKYGTKEQKDYYLPRLAKGIEIPCFALTGPTAGSDASSIPDTGVVVKKMIDGKEVIGITLNWNKRYITLCPVATIIGLAFKLYDPDNLLGKGPSLGISCALIPANTPGVTKGRRHFPLNTGFMNGPTQGKDVFVTLDTLIGGESMAGQGWRMLMECLSAGRAISLPSSALGGAQLAAMASGAYARIRKQFNQPIANFEGIEEPLARIAGNTYIIDAALSMTAAAIDHGAKPAVAGAILKYHSTERARQIIIDAMDIHGGKGICLGPNNYLGRGYQGAPISITVEGANILTRSLIIFGQGAIRCHPYVLAEMESVKKHDLDGFDRAIWGHVGFALSNLIKSVVFAWTDGRFMPAPMGPMHRYYQWLQGYSSNLAFLADFSMLVLGGELKRREKLSARLGDVLSYLYLVSSVLKKFHEDGSPEEDLPIVAWCCQHLFIECALAIRGIISNFPGRWQRFVLKLFIQPLGIKRHKPNDQLGQIVSRLLSFPNETRSRLTRFVFREPIKNCPAGCLEHAFIQICAMEPLEKKVTKAIKEGKLKSLNIFDQIEEAKGLGLLTEAEVKIMHEAETVRQAILAVDDFDTRELAHVDSSSESLNHKKSTIHEKSYSSEKIHKTSQDVV